MKSITIHNLDNELSELIQKLSKAEDISQNKLIKRLLRKALGLSTTQKNVNLLPFSNTMTDKEAEEFFENTSSV